MVEFLRNFISNMLKITKLLRQLLKKDSVMRWTKKCSKSIDSLKNIIISNKVLAPFDVKVPIYIFIVMYQKNA